MAKDPWSLSLRSGGEETKAAEFGAPFLNELKQEIQAKLGGHLTSWG